MAHLLPPPRGVGLQGPFRSPGPQRPSTTPTPRQRMQYPDEQASSFPESESGLEPSNAEDEDLARSTALRWLSRQAFSPQDRREAEEFLALAFVQHIPRERINGLVKIDRGSFGSISRGLWDGNMVAVKQVDNAHEAHVDHQKSNRRPNKFRELIFELRILVQLKHPYCVEYWGTSVDFSVPEPWIGLVFEMCEGGSLHNFIHRDKTRAALSVAQKVSMAYRISVGLNYLHSKRILHRDLNSRNILLTSTLNPKIADFGCSVRPSTLECTPSPSLFHV